MESFSISLKAAIVAYFLPALGVVLVNQEPLNIRVRSQKGSVTLQLGESGTFKSLIQRLNDSESQLPSGCAVVLDLGPRAVSTVEIEQLLSLLASKRIYPKAIRSSSSLTLESMKRMGFYEHKGGAETARVLHGLLRSGDVLEEDRSVVFFGDVNPGGEIVSTQDVIVLGNLRGSAWAGKGQGENTKAFIYALSFSPLLVRIGPFLARAEDRAPSAKPKKGIMPELAMVRQGRIEVIEQSGDVWSWLEPS